MDLEQYPGRRASQLVISVALRRISVFPKCWFDDFVRFERDYVEWIHQAATLGADGVEHYDGFFAATTPGDLEAVLGAQRATGQPTSMLCFSPDFTHPDPDERARQVDRQKRAIDLAVRLGTRYCRTLSGQRYPDLPVEEGVARAADCIKRSLDYAEKRDVVLCIENHYKDGTWRFPEFAQQEDVFLALLDAVGDSPYFGVQYDPSNATVGGFDPVAFLQKIKHRVVTMHASDRYLVPGTRLEEIQQPGRHGRLPRQAEARRHRAGDERLRRHLRHPRGRRVLRLDLGRGRHGRPRRATPFRRVPEGHADEVLRGVGRSAGRSSQGGM